MKSIRTQQGFNLWELMIVVAVLAILTRLAIVTYTSHRLKTNRQNGTQCLVEIQRSLENYYGRFNTYPAFSSAGLAAVGYAASGSVTNCPVSEGSTLYTVALSANTGISGCSNCYQLQASGVGVQANDGALLLLVDPRSSAAAADAYHKQHIPPGGTAVDGWVFQPGKP